MRVNLSIPRGTQVPSPRRGEGQEEGNRIKNPCVITRLVAVAPDGQALNVCDGIIRARDRNALSRAELLEPGRVYEERIQLGSTSYEFAPGFRLRLEVSSSNFPRFDRNLNAGGDIASESVGRPAVQRVFHGGVKASYVMLPVIPR